MIFQKTFHFRGLESLLRAGATSSSLPSADLRVSAFYLNAARAGTAVNEGRSAGAALCFNAEVRSTAEGTEIAVPLWKCFGCVQRSCSYKLRKFAQPLNNGRASEVIAEPRA